MSFKKVLSIMLFIKFKAAKISFIMMDSTRRKYTVREISDIIEQRLNTDPLNNICVRGEIINYRMAPSGHIYFTIQDQKEDDVLECAFFRHYNQDLAFEINNGLDVLASGSIIIYAPQSKYHLKVTSVFDVGIGELIRKKEDLKKKLSEEGLFDNRHKKEIPYLYKTLGLITSEGSAAHRDVLESLRERLPVTVKLRDTRVQGKESAVDIMEALNELNGDEDIGVILIVRGGGPIQDLICFDDENLARAIFYSKKPIITGIGHETDITIADFVADKRALTPTEAAKLAVPNKKEIFDKIKSKRDALKKSYENFVNTKLREINSIRDALKKSYEIFVNAKLREGEVKKKEKIYKIVILMMAIMFIIALMIKLFL
jgi:exodeoxyribonuclease VII large subunit